MQGDDLERDDFECDIRVIDRWYVYTVSDSHVEFESPPTGNGMPSFLPTDEISSLPPTPNVIFL